MKTAWSPLFSRGVPEGHRFPMAKYDQIPAQLLYEGTLVEADLFEPSPASRDLLQSAHAAAYLARWESLTLSPQEVRRSGFPQSAELVEREKRIVQGTYDAALFALADGIGFNIAGGTHHAFSDRAEGFCLLNDLAVTAMSLTTSGRLKRVLIVDLDVHQGNGTAAICAGNEGIFCLSIHAQDNFPYQKEASTLDIGLPNGCDDITYLKTLRIALDSVQTMFAPELVLYQAGVDILETDRLGKLKVSLEGCLERDRLVLSRFCMQGIPIVITMGGSYSPALNVIVEAHCNTFRVARRLFQGR